MTSKLISLLILTSIFSFGFSFVAYSQDQVQFGYVNVAEAVLLHPLMKDFDAGPRRFKLSATKDDAIKAHNENMANLKNELTSAQTEMKKLEEERIKIEKEYTTSLQNLSGKKINSGKSGGISIEKYNEEKNSIDLEFSRKLRTIKTEVQKVQSRINRINKESEYSGHASHAETGKIFGVILDDVYEGVDAVAKFYKIPFVFNSSFEFSRNTNLAATVNPMPEFFSSLDYRLSEDPEGKLTVAAGIKAWLEQKNNSLVNCSDRRLTGFVLKGGVNMTPAVVDYIYQKHEISKSHRDFMQDYFKKIETVE
jgi:Skp family chaperone for outer membrane proteins